MTITDCRPVVQKFAILMEQKLRTNDWKASWRQMKPSWLLRRLYVEAHELDYAVKGRQDTVGSEAADVANFAMMIADKLGALK